MTSADAWCRSGLSSAMDLPAFADDGELDVLRAGSIVVGEIDEEVAEVDALHAVDDLAERRGIRALLPQAVHQDLAAI